MAQPEFEPCLLVWDLLPLCEIRVAKSCRCWKTSHFANALQALLVSLFCDSNQCISQGSSEKQNQYDVCLSVYLSIHPSIYHLIKIHFKELAHMSMASPKSAG